jgi:hypothetical protein
VASCIPRSDRNLQADPSRGACFDVAHLVAMITEDARSRPRADAACRIIPGLGLRHG